MTNIIKVCDKHGDLTENEVIYERSNQYKTGQYIRCKKCKFERDVKDIGRYCKKHGKLALEDIKSNGRCKICHRASANKNRNNNREWFNKRIAEDKEKNPEKWRQHYKNEYVRKNRLYTREEINTNEILRVHNLSYEQYANMLSEQDNKCAICGQPETRKSRKEGETCRLCVDHCHETGTVRGLLCHACNTALGKLNDDIDLFYTAVDYIVLHKKRLDEPKHQP